MYLWEGPAQLGDPGEAPPEPTTHAACPLCGASMSAHGINRDGPNGRTLLHCPRPTTESFTSAKPEPGHQDAGE